MKKRARIDTDRDFINAPDFDNSLAKLMAAYPDGVPLRVMNRALLLDSAEIEKALASGMAKLRTAFEVNGAPDFRAYLPTAMVTAEEMQHMRRMHFECDFTAQEISEECGRSMKTVLKILG